MRFKNKLNDNSVASGFFSNWKLWSKHDRFASWRILRHEDERLEQNEQCLVNCFQKYVSTQGESPAWNHSRFSALQFHIKWKTWFKRDLSASWRISRHEDDRFQLYSINYFEKRVLHEGKLSTHVPHEFLHCSLLKSQAIWRGAEFWEGSTLLILQIFLARTSRIFI